MRFSRSLLTLQGSLGALIRQRLWAQVLLAMVLGVGFGILIGPESGLIAKETAEVIGNWVALPGRLFLVAIQFVVVPLIVASLIRGIAGGEEDARIGRIGLLSALFFILSTIIAVIIGIVTASLIAPGRMGQASALAALGEGGGENSVEAPAAASLPDMADIPGAIVAFFPADPLTTFVGGNMLQIVITAIIFGIALVMLPTAERRPLIALLGSVQAACMVIVGWVLRFAPFAVFGLLAQISAKVGISALIVAGAYVATTLVGLLLLFLLYLLVIWSFAHMAPGPFLRQSREVLLLAFSTSSSAAVMPLTLDTSENKLGVRPAVSRFVIPLGTTINMGGTALYQGVATFFIAQVFGIDIGLAGMVFVVVVATAAAIGSPGTPGVGIVILATVLEGVGVPATGVAIIMGVDRILDMARTTVNVAGDMTASLVIDRWLTPGAAMEGAPGRATGPAKGGPEADPVAGPDKGLRAGPEKTL